MAYKSSFINNTVKSYIILAMQITWWKLMSLGLKNNTPTVRGWIFWTNNILHCYYKYPRNK